MKTLSAGHQAAVATGSTSLAWAIRITRLDAAVRSNGEGVFRFTSGTRDKTIDSSLYLAAPGFDFSSITCTLGFGVDSGEISFLTTDDMTRADFLAGRWRGAIVEVNQYSWAVPADGFIPWPKYRLGNCIPVLGGVKVELRDLRQLMLQNMTRSIAPTCPYRLGDAKCTVDTGPFTSAFTVTSVASRLQFTCSALAGADDYFTNGEVYFADGLYADMGRPLWVLQHEAGGVITLAVPLVDDIDIGQTGSIVAGCMKRKAEDCIAKFDNVLNFGGQDGVTIAQVVGADG